MASSRQLRSKIQATRNIEQITKAMEMVAASKMRRAEERALRARPYAAGSLRLLQNLLASALEEGLSHPLFEQGEGGKTCLFVVTSDKGLCGGLNAAVQRLALQIAKQEGNVAIAAAGKKGREFFAKAGYEIAYEAPPMSSGVHMEDIRPVASFLIDAFVRGTYNNIIACSTTFVSVLRQQAVASRVLPLSIEALEETVKNIVPARGCTADKEPEENTPVSFSVLEPSPSAILEKMVPELVAVRILHLLLEAEAAEHAARMVAMKNASENADEMIERLNRILNKARQNAITQELAEISTAKEALVNE